MIVDKKVINDEDGSVGYIENIYESSNLIKTIYFPKDNRLYISFTRGGTFSYENIDNKLYEDFENAESHGKFFYSNIRNKNKHPFKREFTLYPSELKELNEIVENNKKDEE